MKTGVKLAAALLIPLFFSTLALAADPAPAAPSPDGSFGEGKALVEKSCNACHSPDLFSPEMRKVDSPEKLKEAVEKCSRSEAGWTGQQKAAVVQYLNAAYYKF